MATRAVAENNVIRYTQSSSADRPSAPDEVNAAPIVATAAVAPSQRCHSSIVVASTLGAWARRQPAIAAASPNAAPALRFATATVRQCQRSVREAIVSATAAITTRAIGKCTSNGCNRPRSTMSAVETLEVGDLFPGDHRGLGNTTARRLVFT